jgi:PST family polysaccharide transporter
LGIVQIFSEFGFGSAIVVLRDLSRDEIAQINSVAAFTGIAGLLISVALSEPLARFFHTPQLAMVIVAMSTAFVVSAFKTVPWSLLQRDMRFRSLSFIEMAQSFTQAALNLLFAYLGFSYWALVLGNIAAVVAGTAVTLAYRRHEFRVPHFFLLRRAIRYSWHILVSRACWSAYSDSDFLVVGRLFGAGPLGAYTLGWNLANMPVDKLTSLVGQVTPPFFSALQNDHSQLRKYLRNITEGIALVTFPAAIGLALVGPDFVYTVLGPKWHAAVFPLQVLALYATLRAVTTLLPQVLNVIGESRFGMRNSIATAVAMPLIFLICSRGGINGVALGWVIGYPCVSAPLYVRTFSRIGMKAGDYLGALRAPLTACGVMTVAVVAAHRLCGPLPIPLRLFAEIVTGVAVYSGTLSIFFAARVRAIYNAVRKGAL